MGVNVWIESPPINGTVRPNFIAFGGVSLVSLDEMRFIPPLSVKLKLYKNGVLVGNEVTAEANPGCQNNRWRYEYTNLDTGGGYRLEARLYRNTTELDSDSSDPWSVATAAAIIQELDCSSTEEDSGWAESADDLLKAAAAGGAFVGALGKLGGCCKPPRKPRPFDLAWDFVEKWTAKHTSAVCILSDSVTATPVGITPAVLGLGRVAASFLVPVQKGAEKYVARFALLAEDGKTILLSSGPLPVPRNLG